MKKPRSITVISTTINKVAQYIKKDTPREDGQYLVELTPNLKEAKEYSRATANKLVKKIFNPHHREFAVEDTLR
jgi:hypothetical protein